MCFNTCTGFSSVSGKSKKRKSIVISNPIPCNTAFPTDHASIHSPTENAKDPIYATPIKSQSVREEAGAPQEGSVSSKDVNSSDSDLSSSGTNPSQRQSVCDNESSDGGAESQSPEEAEIEPEAQVEEEAGEKDEGEQTTSQSDDSAVDALKTEGANQEESGPSESATGDAAPSPEPEEASDPPPEEAKTKPPPVPAPRVSFRSDQRPLLSVTKVEKEETPAHQEGLGSGDNCSVLPPGFLYKVR